MSTVETFGPLMVDRNRGSKELAGPLLQLQVPFVVQPLEFGDVAFVGNGPTGNVAIAVERKTIRDLANSLVSNRLGGHQAPGIARHYDQSWLVVEGAWRAEEHTGYVEIPTGKREWKLVEPMIKARDLNAWLLTYEMFAGMHVRVSYDITATAHFLAALQQWWSKPWDKHKAHMVMYQPSDTLFMQPSLVRNVAKQLPGIGYDRSRAVEAEFATVFDLVNAEESRWRTITGIGKQLAERVYQAIRGK